MPLISGGIALTEGVASSASCLPILVQLLLFSYVSIFIHVHSLTFFFLNDLLNAILHRKRSITHTNSVENGHLSSSQRRSTCSLIKEMCGYMDINAYLSVSPRLCKELPVTRAKEENAVVKSSKAHMVLSAHPFSRALLPKLMWLYQLIFSPEPSSQSSHGYICSSCFPNSHTMSKWVKSLGLSNLHELDIAMAFC